MALITQTRWEARRWNAAGIERLDGVPTAVLDCWGVRLRKRWLSAALNAGRSVADGYEFDLSTKARLRWLHRPVDRLGFDWLEGGVLKEQIVLDRLAAVPDPAIFDVLIELPPGVALHYQPPLTQEEIDSQTIKRPAPVVGSYAIYDAAGCKIGHIFRPYAETATGQRRWLDLGLLPHPQGNVLRIALDRPALAALPPAAWPVTIDPTFGYTSVGATGNGAVDNTIRAFGLHAPASSGDATSVTYYAVPDRQIYATFGIYADSSGTPGSLLKDTKGQDYWYGDNGWKTLKLDSTLAITSGTNYWLAVANNSRWFKGYYDSVSGFYIKANASTYNNGTLPNPYPTSGMTTGSNVKYSIYVTYTATETPYAWLPRETIPGRPRPVPVPY